MSNALQAIFEECGQRQTFPTDAAQSQISHTALEDASFDRQLLGACSLDVVGPELLSLIAQVKDILPDFSDEYVEVRKTIVMLE